jgi:hypothetical protein
VKKAAGVFLFFLVSAICSAQVVCKWANMRCDPCDMSEHPHMKTYSHLNGKVKKLEEYRTQADYDLEVNGGDTAFLTNTVTFYPSGLMKTYGDPEYYDGYYTLFEYDKNDRCISEKRMLKGKVVSLYQNIYSDHFDQGLIEFWEKKTKEDSTISDVSIISPFPGNKDATIETTIRAIKYRHGRQVEVKTDTLTEFVKSDKKTSTKLYYRGALNPRKIEFVSASGEQGYKMVSDLEEHYLEEKVDANDNLLYFNNGCEVYSTYAKNGRKIQDSIVDGGHTVGHVIRYGYSNKHVTVTDSYEETTSTTYVIDQHGNWIERWGIDDSSERYGILEFRKITYFD